MSAGLIALLSGAVAALVSVAVAYVKGRRDGAKRAERAWLKGYADTRKRMDDAPKYLDPDAARDAMRLRDPKSK